MEALETNNFMKLLSDWDNSSLGFLISSTNLKSCLWKIKFTFYLLKDAKERWSVILFEEDSIFSIFEEMLLIIKNYLENS